VISYRFSSSDRALSALIKAPLVPVAIVFLLDAYDRVLQLGPLAVFGAAILAFYILIVMEFVSLLVGGLILKFLWNRMSFNLWFTSLLGGLIAILPLVGMLVLPNPDYNAWVDGKPTVISGQTTSHGHSRNAETLAVVFAFGALGGASFWWFGRPRQVELGRPDDDR